ncbi:hypothetical protein HRW07_08705 [Streptomyces lunaelactis]|uniref:plasmid mobilization protein n=1 Tax=Streptomyces lunaelactis TaxID=1535768 RepID=UPI0015844B26|nr:hypothetical protein [Streptomyces lunaelactis]NUL03318.1 hypothetical protein [Streptomyces lunaelactis]
MTDPKPHEISAYFSSAERAALVEHADDLGISLEEYIQQSATGRALTRLEERRKAGDIPVDVEATLHHLFGAPRPGHEHRAWANEALGNT